MKRVLLGTTALVAAALLPAGPASAQSAPASELDALKQQILQLQQKYQALQNQVDQSQAEARRAEAAAAQAMAGQGATRPPPAAPAPAPAQKITANLGGQFLFGYAAMLRDDNNAGQAAYKRRFDGFQEDFLARFSAEGKFDNGIDAGVFVRLRAENTAGPSTTTVVAHTANGASYTLTTTDPYMNDTFKDAYIRLKSDAFGEFRFGDDADVRWVKGYWAPQICDCSDGFFASDEPQLTVNNGPVGTNSTTSLFDDRATKVAWYSPVIEGFQLAISYAPDRGKGHRLFGSFNETPTNGLGGQTATIDDNAEQNFRSAALSWDGQVGDVTLGADAGYTGASHASNGTTTPVVGLNDANPFMWNAGGQVGYGPWKLGGSFELEHGINFVGVYGAAGFVLDRAIGAYVPGVVKVNDIVTRVFDLGATYSIGPVTLGAAWSRGIYEGLADPLNIKRTSDNDVIVVGANYLIDPGVSLLGGFQFNHYAPGGPYVPLTGAGLNAAYGGSDSSVNVWGKGYDGLALILGTAVRF